MTEDELIDIMKTAFLATHPFPDVSVALRAALAVARPIIEHETLEKAATTCLTPIKRPAGYEGRWEGYGSFESLMDGKECAAALRSLMEKSK